MASCGNRPATAWFGALTGVLLMGLSACGSAEVAGAAGPATPPPSVPAGPGAAATPEAAVAAWVPQILREQYTEACLSSVLVNDSGGDPATTCKSAKMTRTLKGLHDAWSKPGVTPDSKVTVAKVDAQGDEAKVPDTSVKVGDRTLRDLELIGSSGNTGSFKLELKVRKKDGAWYVSDMNISF